MLTNKYSKVLNSVAEGFTEDEDNLITTGFKEFDKKINGGLRRGCCYLFTGIEKSGKSSFLFNVLHERLMDNLPTGILSTEMDCNQLTRRMKTIAGLKEDDISGTFYWKEQVESYLSFYGKDELTTPSPTGAKYDFKKFLLAMDTLESEGVELIIIDNLTTLGSQASDYKVLGNMVSQLFAHTSGKKYAVIFVIHVKGTTGFKETSQGVKKMIKDGKPEQMFSESITVINRPTLNDVYGGGQSLSQISGGAFMLWRPFQKYSSYKFQKLGMLVVDTHRFGPSCDIQVEYTGETGKFKILS